MSFFQTTVVRSSSHPNLEGFQADRKLESIVFDFDGTLSELRIDFGEMRERVGVLARDHSLHCPDSTLPVLEWMNSIVQRADQDQKSSEAQEFHRKARELILDMELDAALQGRLFSFTRSILLDLRSRSVKTAIITRNCEQAVRSVFPDLDEYCDYLLTRDHVARVKPHPDHLLQALEKLSTTPERTLMVGDHPMDIETGKRANTSTAGVWSGKTPQEKLARSKPHWMAPDCRSLISILIDQALI